MAESVLGTITEDNAMEGLDKQVQSHMRIAASELASSVESRFATVESAVRFTSSLIAQSEEDAFPLDPLTPDYQHNAVPPQFLHPIGRLGNLQGSLNYSTVYNAPSPPVSGGSTAAQQASSTFMYFWPTLYEQHSNIASMYVGWTNGLFRQYPGVERSDLSYQPWARPWYVAAEAARPSSGSGTNVVAVHTAPYVDASGLGWMISVAAAAGNQGAVASVDVTIANLQQSVLDVTFYGQAAASLVRLDGTVVASPHWDAGAGGADVVKLWETDAGISQSVFSTMTNAAEPSVYTVGDRWVTRAFVPTTGTAEYVVLVDVDIATARQPADGLGGKISASFGQLAGLTVGLAVVTLLVSLAGVWCVAKRVTEPLQSVHEIADKITSNAAGDLGEGLDGAKVGEATDEIGEFIGEFQQMVSNLVNRPTRHVSTRSKDYVPNRWRDLPDADKPWKGLGGGGAAGHK